LELNENEAGGWLTAPLVGHGSSPEIFSISMADGLMLEQAGMVSVKHLFKPDDITGRLLVSENCSYDGIPPNIATKCRVLRMRLCALGKRIREMPEGTFSQVIKEVKMSQLYRKMYRKHVDGLLPGPPSYFTRRKDGIPVPSLAEFMKGYDNLFKLNIPSKTLETSFLLLNRQIWTNAKESMINRENEEEEGGPGEGGAGRDMREGRCSLCQGIENTMHLMFECPVYSGPIWEALEIAINTMLKNDDPDSVGISLHAYQVLYNVYRAPIPKQHDKQIMELCQEIKRNMIYRRYVRCNDARALAYSRLRILGHILNVLEKLRALRRFQGKNHGTLCALIDIFREQIANN
jgi:hypothetical protein